MEYCITTFTSCYIEQRTGREEIQKIHSNFVTIIESESILRALHTEERLENISVTPDAITSGQVWNTQTLTASVRARMHTLHPWLNGEVSPPGVRGEPVFQIVEKLFLNAGVALTRLRE